jgi:ubiquitin C-terminal hydrolase
MGNFLKNTLGGKLCNETRSLEDEYPYVGERDEDFYAITLDIKNKKSLQEALDMYIKPDILEGDNKYHCEEHDRKISA